MEAINQESVVAPGDLKEAPISVTTTETNLTGSWKFFRPVPAERTSPCSESCPLHNDIREIISRLAQNDRQSALQILREHNPLPAVTGRVCPHFCQERCTRKGLDQEVLIGRIERYLGDLGLETPFPAPEEKTAGRAAVVGSGPAGLAAAYFLARENVRVTVFERDPEPGGLLRYGIPDYRLPKELLAKEVDNLLSSLSIELVCNRQISLEDLSSLLADYDCIFCAPGLSSSVFPAEFQGQPHVYQGLDLLHRLNAGQPPPESSFAVIGGGNAAVDTARSLLRLGKEVSIVYRRTVEEMPAYPEEKAQALAEGIPILERRIVSGLREAQGGLRLTLCQAVRQEDGRISPGSEAGEMDSEALVLAVGQKKETDFPASERVYFGGDFAMGAGTVVQAMASGRDAAARMLSDMGTAPSGRWSRSVGLEPSQAPTPSPDYLQPEAPLSVPELDPGARKTSFEEVSPPPEASEIQAALSRCLQCGSCSGCSICWFFCPDVAIRVQSEDQTHNVDVDLEHCKGCGLCAAVCPRGVIHMEEDV